MAKTLHTSPFDPKISELTPPQILWLILNHEKDREEQFDLVKLICRFINPEGAKLAFDQQDEITEVSDDAFLDEIQRHASANISKVDLAKRLHQLQNQSDEPDTIERIN